MGDRLAVIGPDGRGEVADQAALIESEQPLVDQEAAEPDGSPSPRMSGDIDVRHVGAARPHQVVDDERIPD